MALLYSAKGLVSALFEQRHLRVVDYLRDGGGRLGTCPAVAVLSAAPVAAHDWCRGALPTARTPGRGMSPWNKQGRRRVMASGVRCGTVRRMLAPARRSQGGVLRLEVDSGLGVEPEYVNRACAARPGYCRNEQGPVELPVILPPPSP